MSSFKVCIHRSSLTVHLSKMALTTLTDQLVHDMCDLWSAETEIHRQLPAFAQAAHRKELQEILVEYAPVVANHIAGLETLVRIRGRAPDSKPCRAIAALAEANEQHLLPQDADAAVKDAAIIGAIARVQHYKIAGYRCLLTYAIQLEALPESTSFRQYLADEASFLRQLRKAELLVTEDAEQI
jgi:ferritin-like metal-binding protein YciE